MGAAWPRDRKWSPASLLWVSGFLLVLAGLTWPLWQGRIYIANDLGLQHLPTRHFYAECLKRFQSPLWFPGVYSGFYLHGEGQVGMFHPLHALLYLLLPLPAAFSLESWLSYPFLFAGCYLLFHRWLRREAALCGAFVFTFSGFNTLHFIHLNAIAVVAHYPWLLLAIHLALCETEPRRVRAAEGAVLLLTVSQLLLGHPQAVLYSVLLEGAYAGLLARSGKGGVRGWARLLAVKALAALAGSVQLLPTWEALSLSVRAGPSADFRSAGSLHPVQFLQLVAPTLYQGRIIGAERISDATWEFGVYNGAFSTLALVWLSVRARFARTHERLARGLLALAAFSALLAIGGFLPGFSRYSALPPLSLFRVPSRAIVLLHFACAGAAALAYSDAAEPAGPGGGPRLREAWPLAVPALAGLALLWLAWSSSGRLHRGLASLPLAAIGPVLLAAAAALLLLAARGSRHAALALAAVVVLDHAGFACGFIRASPAHGVESYAALMRAREGPPTPPPYRVDSRVNALTLSGASLVGGYMALEPRRRLDYRREEALRVAGAEWTREGTAWRRVPGPLPRARLVDAAVAGGDPARLLASIDPERVAVVDRELRLLPGPAGLAELVRERPGDLEIAVRAPSARLLVVSESFHPGWRVSIDGRPGAAVRVYGDFLGCVVDAGARRVRFTFAPASFRLGAWLSALGAALAALFFRLGRPPARRSAA
ncbi:MAG: hypothetical protein HY554_08170 [Elusimicrobia bacterium]|nr:hypothetical protein [Elusimicrobiota bacterium]